MTTGFDHSYARLGAAFSTSQPPDPVSSPQLLLRNGALADANGRSNTPQSVSNTHLTLPTKRIV